VRLTGFVDSLPVIARPLDIIGVLVVGGTAGGTLLISLAVAVIIYAVAADLGGPKINSGVAVVTITAYRGSIVTLWGAETPDIC
jgi:hypothetical protein